MLKFKPGDTAYIIENNLNITKVQIRSFSGGFYLLRLSTTGGGTRLREDRLFATKEEAEEELKGRKQKRLENHPSGHFNI